MLYYYQDFSYAQIADILAINEQSVRNLLQRGLHKLRQFAFLSSTILLFVFFFLRK